VVISYYSNLSVQQHGCGWLTGISAQQALDDVAYLLSALLLALSRTLKPATTQGQGQSPNALDQRKNVWRCRLSSSIPSVFWTCG